ncbi:MAG TPA: tetratricopeptide repeat protein [Phycisphaerae bacterium]|nr:tetratricopeptide repeat protein [Phycisphaerae bacterium]
MMAQRRLNKKLVTGLTVGLLVVVAVGGVVLIASLPQTDPTPYVKQATDAYQASDFEKAYRAYTQAWNVAQDPQWLVEAGYAAKRMGSARDAQGAWRRAIRANTSMPEPRRAIVELLLELSQLPLKIGLTRSAAPNDCAVLFEEGRALLALDSERESPLGHYACGWALSYMREITLNDTLEPDTDKLRQAEQRAAESDGLISPTWALAEMYLNRAGELSPDDPNVAEALASLYRRQGAHAQQQRADQEIVEQLEQQAKQVYEDLLKRHEQLVQVHVNYAYFLAGQRQSDEALQQARRAVELGPDDPDAHLCLARVYWARQDYDKAEQAFLHGKQLDPDRFDIYLNLGRYYQTYLGDVEKALTLYRAALDRPIDRTSYRASVDRALRFMLLVEMGQALVAQAEREPGDRNAFLASAQQKHDEAIAEYRETYLTDSLQGAIYRASGRLPEAILFLEKVDRVVSPQNDIRTYASNKGVLADLYLKTNKPGLAETQMQAVLEAIPGNLGAVLTLGVIYNRMNQPEQALHYADMVLNADSDNRQALMTKIEAYRQLGQTEKIEPLRKKLGGQTAEEKTRLAMVFMLEDEFEQAEKELLGVLADDPAYVPALRILLPRYVSTGQQGKAEQLYKAARAAKPDSPQIAALQLLVTTADDEAQRVEQIERFLKNMSDPLARAMSLALFYVGTGETDKAAEQYDAAEQLSADNRSVIDGQFRLALRMKDWQKAQRYVGRARELNLDGASGGFFEGTVHLAQAAQARSEGNVEEANRHLALAVDALESALRTFPSDVSGHIQLGTAYSSLGRYDEAVTAYRRAVALNPNSGQAHRLLAQLLTLTGQSDMAQEHLTAAIRLLPNDPWVRQQRQNILEEQNPQQAIEGRERRRQDDPADVANLRRLAALYQKLGRNDEAEQRYREALETAPQDLALAWEISEFYRQTDRPQRAEEVLKQLVRDVEQDQKVTAELALARHFRRVGDLAEAEKAYKVALTLDPTVTVCAEMADFYVATQQIPESIKWLERALEAARQESKPLQQRDVHRQLVDLLLATYQREQAETQLDQYLQDYPDDAWAYILMGRLRNLQNRIDEAVQAYTRAIELDPDSALAHFQLGALHYTLGNLSEAIDQLRAAKNIDSTGFGYAHRILLAECYRVSGQIELGINEMRSILEADPDATRVVSALVKLLGASKRYEELETLLREYMGRQPDDGSWPLTLGTMAENQGDFVKAQIAYMQAMQISNFDPVGVEAMLRLLTRAGRHEKVIEVVENVIPADRQTPLTDMRVAAALHHMGREEEAVQRYSKAIEGAVGAATQLTNVVGSMAQTLGLERTIDMLEKRAGGAPDNTDMQYVLAVCLSQAGQRSRAINMLEGLAAKTSDPRRKVDCLMQLAGAQHMERRLEEAAAAYTEVLRVDPKTRYALNNLAYLLAEDLGRPAEAMRYAERAFQLAREDANVIDTLGWVECLNGQYDAAIGTLRSALAIDPDMVAAVFHLGEAYRRSGNLPLAEQYLQKALELAEATDDVYHYLEGIRESLAKLPQPSGR